MTQLIKLVIGALVALDLAAAGRFIELTLQANYVENDRGIVSLDCDVGGSGRSTVTSVKFIKRIGMTQYRLYRGPSAGQLVILDQNDTSITFRFSRTQEGYFRCQTHGGDYLSNEIGLAGKNAICLIHV